MKPFPFSKNMIDKVLTDDDGWDEFIKVRENYVGKGQSYGCMAFTAPDVRNVMAFMVRLAGETEAEGVELTDLIDAVTNVRWDSMGRDEVIVYFPEYTLTDRFPDEDDDPGVDTSAETHTGWVSC
jgi:hypothetical protein